MTDRIGESPRGEVDLAAIARSIVDANRFMALGTADLDGTPWVSPVWYATETYREYIWISRPGARHSRNLTGRPQVAITIYDSHRPGDWAALYLTGTAAEVGAVDAALAVFNRRGARRGSAPGHVRTSSAPASSASIAR